MHELITVALVLTCLCALVILVACIWAIVETEIKISIRVLPMDEVTPASLERRIAELDEQRSQALDELASYYTHEIYIDGVKQQ